MTMDDKDAYIEKYIRDASLVVNSQYGMEIIDEEMISSALTMFKNSSEDLETEIIPKIDQAIQNVVNNFLEQFKEVKDIISIESINPDQLDVKFNSNSQGMYISSLMLVGLSLVNCSNVEEINQWIDSVPNLYMVPPIQEGNYSAEQIDEIKRKLFDLYQDSMITTDAIKEIKGADKDEALSYSLHKKISGLNLSLEDEIRLSDIYFTEGLPALYEKIQQICIEKYGEKGRVIASKIVNYNVTDFENFNSSTYEQMQDLNEEIKSNIKKCREVGGDYQLVINSLCYRNTVNELVDGSFEYNYDTSKMGQELSEKLGASYRLRSMIGRLVADEMITLGFSKEDKEKVIQILRDSLAESLKSFNSNIEVDGKNRTFELFNELVEIKKDNKDYKCVWEDRFGITIEDLVREVIAPNAKLIRELKAKNVDFMYNETLLQESSEKRSKVMETMIELQKLAPGLITSFGDQDHTFGFDYNPSGIEELKAVAKFDKKMAETVFRKDDQAAIISFTDVPDIKVKIECTEKDLYLSQSETRDLERKGLSKEDILKYKQARMNTHAEIFKDVPFKRECEWTVIDNISGDYYERGMDTKQDAYIGRYIRISSMAREDNLQRVNRDLADFNKWKQARILLKQQIQKLSEKVESFAQRSQGEIQIAEQIKQKNQLIKEQKAKQKQLEKLEARKLVLTNPNVATNDNNGHINTIIILLVACIIVGILSVAAYMLIGR